MTAVAAATGLAAEVLDAVRKVVGAGPVALHEPRFAGNELKYVSDCIETNYVSSVGAYVERFEREIADYVGVKRAVAVMNGTAALQIAMKLAGVQPGDEVILPALTFVATANAVSQCGAIPHFVDSEERTLGLDAAALRSHLSRAAQRRGGELVNRATGRVIRALVPMHTFGHPSDLDGLLSVAADFKLPLVEDAAESLGSTYHGRHCGTFGLLSTLSFNGNKTVTTGGGGAILTNDEAIGRHAKHITSTAKIPHRWEYRHDEVAYNYRMPNLNAALGCAQLEQLPSFVESKRRLYDLYSSAFAGIAGVRLFGEPEGCHSNYWLQTLVLDEARAGERDLILAATNDAGVMTRPAWTLMHRLAPYRNAPRAELPVAESLERRIVNIPSSPFLGQNR